MLDYRPKMFDEASKSHASKKLIIILLCFIAFFIVTIILESIIPGIMSSAQMVAELEKNGYLDGTSIPSIEESMRLSAKISSTPRILIASLFSTVFGTAAALIYCRCIEMRPVRSMGLRKKGLAPHYLLGLLVGIALMSAISLLGVVSGTNRITICSEINYKLIALYFFGFFIQGMSEEFIFRGYLMTTVGGSGRHTAVAVAISSVGFSLAHTANPGFGILPFVNLTLFGVFAALYMIIFDDIWGVSAIHSIWNFTQGNFYGISVSGMDDTESVFRTTAISSKDYLTGGDFGIEGSIFTTTVLLAGTAVLLFILSKKKQPAATEAALQS